MFILHILSKVYYNSKTSGIETAAQRRIEINKASMTAAEPKSFALLERSWCSKEIRSIAASTLELSNSITKTITNEEIRRAFSKRLIGITRAIGVRNANRVSSCLNALSSIIAYTNPHQEFLAACHARVKPLFPLPFCSRAQYYLTLTSGLEQILCMHMHAM